MLQKKNNFGTEAIVVLGGGLVCSSAGTWRVTRFGDRTNKVSEGGEDLSIIAASILYKKNKNNLLIASGGKGPFRNNPKAPAVAQIVKQELIKLGVRSGIIIEENQSNNTFQQLREIKNIIKKYHFGKITIISNQYHLPRIKALLKYAPKLKGIDKVCKIHVISAEKILLTTKSKEKWMKLIDRAYLTPGMKERSRLENIGVRQIKAGIYKYN